MSANTDIRCPACRRKVGDFVAGIYRTTCPRCGAKVEIVKLGTARFIDASGTRRVVHATVDPDE